MILFLAQLKNQLEEEKQKNSMLEQKLSESYKFVGKKVVCTEMFFMLN